MSSFGNTYYGTGNSLSLTSSASGGSYNLGYVAAIGANDLNVTSGDSSAVSATIQLAALGLLASYTITAEAHTTVVVNSGTINLLAGVTLDADGGSMSISGGLLNALQYVTVNITNGGIFSGAASLISAASGLTINFGNGGGTLNLAASSTNIALLSGATINGFGAGDEIIVSSNGSLTTITGVTYNSLLGTSTISFRNGDTLLLNGQYTDQEDGEGTYLSTQSVSGTNGTELVVACYAKGTAIRTVDGEVSVEKLQIGDLVRTVSGDLKPVLWIGYRSYSSRFAGINPNVMPITFKRGSLGKGLPVCDLTVSPKHALLIDGVLVQAESLVNERTIFRSTLRGVIEYYHIELEDHDVIYAEGAPSETFIDDSSRSMFHNVDDYYRRYPDRNTKDVYYCAPRLEEGSVLESIRQNLQSTAENNARLSA